MEKVGPFLVEDDVDISVVVILGEQFLELGNDFPIVHCHLDEVTETESGQRFAVADPCVLRDATASSKTRLTLENDC